MASLYQVYEPSQMHGCDFDHSPPVSLADAFRVATKLEAEEAIFREEFEFIPARTPSYVVQPSPWGRE